MNCLLLVFMTIINNNSGFQIVGISVWDATFRETDGCNGLESRRKNIVQWILHLPWRPILMKSSRRDLKLSNEDRISTLPLSFSGCEGRWVGMCSHFTHFGTQGPNIMVALSEFVHNRAAAPPLSSWCRWRRSKHVKLIRWSDGHLKTRTMFGLGNSAIYCKNG